MKKTLFICFLLFIILVGRGQDHMPELITDRPDQTESSITVPLKHLQIETGFVMKGDDSERIKQTSYAYNTTLIRYGLLKNMEIRLVLEYLGGRTKSKEVDTTSSQIGFFVESYGSVPESEEARHLFDTGITFLLMPNLQFDLSGGLGVNNNAIDHFAGFCVSNRVSS
jgi:hypothetical protein